MKDEIKEILDKLKDGNWYEELDLTGTMWIELRWAETHLLLDYITNLQEKVNQYENPDDMTLFYMWLDEKAKDKMKKLQEKYDITQKDIEILTNNYNDLVKMSENKITNLQEENMRLISENEAIKNIKYTVDEIIYKSRNEKAIEYIKENARYDDETCYCYDELSGKECDELLNILEGSDKE